MSEPFLEFVDLASERLGASVVAANDEFFGEKERLIASLPPVWKDGLYTDRGKWMDGWETRRRREAGHDWCVIRLGASGIVRGVDVETTHFKGNYPEAFAIDVSDGAGPGFVAGSDAAWHEVLPRTRLKGDAHNLFPIDRAPRASHLRLRIFPDGGVARLRVYGEVVPDWQRLRRRGQIDLAAIEHGGIVVAASDMFFGHRHNLVMPGEPQSMAEGWETRRRRGGGHDWTVVRLGAAGTIERVEVDTRHFKGNAPGACSLEACAVPSRHPAGGEVIWRELLPRTPLQPDARRTFEDELAVVPDVSYVRFNIFPDGGVARLRLFGRPFDGVQGGPV
jgi:allantoicase